MFFKLIRKNSRRSRKENGLFFSSMVASIIAFYIILSLSKQDVMVFLKKMESHAVDKLYQIIPAFFCLTLVILFFLIYYASRFQMERRTHELGMYLMLGMRRRKLFFMLLAEDVGSSFLALLVGLPIAFFLSELISLITSKCVGLGIIGHHVTFSLSAVGMTAAGFCLIKLTAFVILSGKMARTELGSLLTPSPAGTKEQRTPAVYAASLLFGITGIALACYWAISKWSWRSLSHMGVTLALGTVGIYLFFYGLRFLVRHMARFNGGTCLRVFNFRQLEETVIYKSGMFATVSLLILAALCCFGAGMSTAIENGGNAEHLTDYTFVVDDAEDAEAYTEKLYQFLQETGLSDRFSDLFEVETGYVQGHEDTAENLTDEDETVILDLTSVIGRLEAYSDTNENEKMSLIANLNYAAEFPHLISLSGYNQMLALAGQPELTLAEAEAAVYRDDEWANSWQNEMLNAVLSETPEVTLAGESLTLTGSVQSTNFVTDRATTYSFALIVPDALFDRLTAGSYEVYVNGVLNLTDAKNAGLMAEIMDVDAVLEQHADELKKITYSYENYLESFGRKLFYIVAASYITLYLAIIFLIIANTVIGVQFLMGQRKSERRYRTLARLGAGHRMLVRSAKTQINWYFGLPVLVAAGCSLFGVKGIFAGILADSSEQNVTQMLLIAAAMIFLLLVVEYLYMSAVKRISARFLLTIAEPQREE